MSCIDDEILVALVEGRLEPPARDDAERHLAECSTCRHAVAAWARCFLPESSAPAESDDAASFDALPAGSQIEDWKILRRLGAGSQGVVYAALDVRLDRTVALKILRTRVDASMPAEKRERMMREARAMARLSHPSIVVVHDVGIFEDHLFLVMGFVDGVNLRAWIAQGPHDWRQVIAVLAQAGKGLCAAHDAGWVHRDFKPDNVLVDSSGHALVTDFGLARLSPFSQVGQASAPDAQALAPEFATNTVAGTPAYMAPEVRQGEAATHRSDIYSFCMTAIEALSGGRGQALPLGLPASLRRALKSGIDARPERRPASMATLLAAMEPEKTRSRQWIWTAATLMIAILIVMAGRSSLFAPRNAETQPSGARPSQTAALSAGPLRMAEPVASSGAAPIAAAPVQRESTPRRPVQPTRSAVPQLAPSAATAAPSASSTDVGMEDIGFVTILSNVPCKAWVDRQPLGTTPRSDVPMKAGIHRIECVEPAHGIGVPWHSATITVKPGAHHRVMIQVEHTETR